MSVIHDFVGANCIHIGIESIAGGEPQVGKSHALPLCEGLHKLNASAPQRLNGKRGGKFHSIQVVIYAKARVYKKRCGNSRQVELERQVVLEELLYFLYGNFRLPGIEQRLVVVRHVKLVQVTHRNFPSPPFGVKT